MAPSSSFTRTHPSSTRTTPRLVPFFTCRTTSASVAASRLTFSAEAVTVTLPPTCSSCTDGGGGGVAGAATGAGGGAAQLDSRSRARTARVSGRTARDSTSSRRSKLKSPATTAQQGCRARATRRGRPCAARVRRATSGRTRRETSASASRHSVAVARWP